MDTFRSNLKTNLIFHPIFVIKAGLFLVMNKSPWICDCCANNYIREQIQKDSGMNTVLRAIKDMSWMIFKSGKNAEKTGSREQEDISKKQILER